MMLFLKLIIVALALAVTLKMEARAQFDDSSFRSSLKLKKGVYLGDGAFTGGDRSHTNFRIQNIRIASNPAGYDRVVFDFAGNHKGEASELARPPYYLVDVDGLNKRVLVTLYGRPQLDFSMLTTTQAAKKSKTLTGVQFLPVVHSDRWIMVIDSKKAVQVEAFDLSQPARLILDFKH